ncbi:PucR family transcriptional regulator [Sutcliffiella halmapala]|uniref:PucR family transcriptional regulator n=1 Tax=Sutcliffiella halmapala TaxID=79882 RepID=UPI000994DF56|nr:helix-turn-helix domain-containing protein [Sutcliffiella halmapala]
MYNQLKRIYKDSLLQASIPHSFDRYEWFLSPSNDYFGIEKNRLEEKETLLLETFLQKVTENQFSLTTTEKWWHSLLFQYEHRVDSSPYSVNEYCRFIHFQFSEPFLHKEEWKEALTAFFNSKIELIWETATSGVLIEVFSNSPKPDETISFSDIVDTTASDFYTNVKLYLGAITTINKKTKELYLWEKQCFTLSLKARKKNAIHTFEQAIPYLITGQLDNDLIAQIKMLFGPVFEDEQELLQSIKIYIENNLNVSLTAKKLFMHRNSLQYRIDKFSERTGIDIRNFQGALATYLAIIILETER